MLSLSQWDDDDDDYDYDDDDDDALILLHCLEIVETLKRDIDKVAVSATLVRVRQNCRDVFALSHSRKPGNAP